MRIEDVTKKQDWLSKKFCVGGILIGVIPNFCADGSLNFSLYIRYMDKSIWQQSVVL